MYFFILLFYVLCMQYVEYSLDTELFKHIILHNTQKKKMLFSIHDTL